MDIRRGDSGLEPQVVGIPCREGRDDVALRNDLDVHRRDRIDGTRDDGIGADAGTELVQRPEQLRQAIEGGMELWLAPSKPPNKLPERLEVPMAEVVGVRQARRVYRDDALVLVVGVRVCRLRDRAARFRQAFDVVRIHADVPR